MHALPPSELVMRLGASLLVGALIGLERERKHRPAGFRTMILIALGSAGFVLAGLQAIGRMESTGGSVEISRVLQGLVSGIGFLGAGAVIQNKKAVRGLTTAAAVWVTASVGAICGLGEYVLAGILAAFMLFTLITLERVEDKLFPESVEDQDPPKKHGHHDEGQGTERMRGEPGNGD